MLRSYHGDGVTPTKASSRGGFGFGPPSPNSSSSASHFTSSSSSSSLSCCCRNDGKVRTQIIALLTIVSWAFLLFFFEPHMNHAIESSPSVTDQMLIMKENTRRLSILRKNKALGRGRKAGEALGLAGCSDIDPSFIADRLKGAVLRRTRPALQTGYGGAPFTPSTILRVHPCARGAWELGLPDADRDFVFVVMGGSFYRDRAIAMRATWGTLVPFKSIVLFGDVNDTRTGMITLDILAGKPKYEDAQHRTLEGLIHTMTTGLAGEALWVFLVDDDTYVNVHELPGFLVGWDSRIPLIFAHVWYGPEAREKDEGAWPSGGAGIVLSRRAADLLAEALYSPLCPFLGLNDVTIGHCATKLGIPMIHSPVFDPEGNVMVAETRTVKRKVRLDGSFARPTSCFREQWTPLTPEGAQPKGPKGEEINDEPVGPDGEKLSPQQLEAIWGRPDQWYDGEERVVVRKPLKDVYKTRTSVEGPIFLHR